MRSRFSKRLGLESLESRDVPAVFAFADSFAQATQVSGGFQVQSGRAVTSTDGTSLTTLPGLAIKDVAVQADVAISAGSNLSAGLVARYSGPGESNFYLAEALGTPGEVTLSLYRNHAGRFKLLAAVKVPDATGVLRFEAEGADLRLYLNGALKIAGGDTLLEGFGSVGVRANGPAGQVSIADLSYEALTQPDATLGAIDPFAADGRLTRDYVTRVGEVKVLDGHATNATNLAIATLRGISQRDQIVTARVDIAARSDLSAGLMARYSGPGESNFYLAEVFGSPASAGVQVNIYLKQAGAYRRLNSNLLAGDAVGALRFEVVGSSQRVYLNDALVVSANDGTLDGPASAGFRLSGAPGAVSLDDFGVSGQPAPVTLASVQVEPPALPEPAPQPEPAPVPPVQPPAAATDPGDGLGAGLTVKSGSFRVSGGAITNGAPLAIATFNGIDAGEMRVMADVSIAAGSGQSVGLVGRYSGDGEGSGYLAEMYGKPGVNGVVVNLYRRSGGVLTTLNSTTTALGVGRLEFSLTGSSLAVYMGDTLLVSARDSLLTRGTAGLRLSGPQGLVSVAAFAADGSPRSAPADTLLADPVGNGTVPGVPNNGTQVSVASDIGGRLTLNGFNLPFGNLVPRLDRP